eukprot:2183105-Pyramimonas_sp.AAC.4
MSVSSPSPLHGSFHNRARGVRTLELSCARSPSRRWPPCPPNPSPAAENSPATFIKTIPCPCLLTGSDKTSQGSERFPAKRLVTHRKRAHFLLAFRLEAVHHSDATMVSGTPVGIGPPRVAGKYSTCVVSVARPADLFRAG